MPGEGKGPRDDIMLGDMLCFALYSASHAFTRFYKPMLDHLGLTYPQFLVVVALGEADDQTVGQISARLLLDSATVTPLLKRLEGARLLTRRRDPHDERQVRVALTAAGRETLAQLSLVPACVTAQLAQPVTELRALKDRVDALRVALDAAPIASNG